MVRPVYIKWAPSTMARWPDPRRGPWSLVGHWAEIDGYLECVGVELRKGFEKNAVGEVEALEGGPTGIAGNDLRLPTARILRALRARGHWLSAQHRREYLAQAELVQDRGPEGAAAAARFRARADATFDFDAPPQRRTTTKDREHFVEVARVYQEATRDRVPPTKAVAEELNLAPSTAEKHVRKARELGLLSPTGKGRASKGSAPERPALAPGETPGMPSGPPEAEEHLATWGAVPAIDPITPDHIAAQLWRSRQGRTDQ